MNYDYSAYENYLESTIAEEGFEDIKASVKMFFMKFIEKVIQFLENLSMQLYRLRTINIPTEVLSKLDAMDNYCAKILEEYKFDSNYDILSSIYNLGPKSYSYLRTLNNMGYEDYVANLKTEFKNKNYVFVNTKDVITKYKRANKIFHNIRAFLKSALTKPMEDSDPINQVQKFLSSWVNILHSYFRYNKKVEDGETTPIDIKVNATFEV